LVDIVGHGETPIRQLIQTALIKKADSEFSLLFALEKPPSGLAYFGLKHRSLMMDKSIRHGSFEMTAAMLISGTIGWFVLVSGQPVLDVVFWRCVFGAGTLLLICAAFGFLRPGILTRTTFLLAVLSGVAIVGNWVLLFASYSRASIAIGTAVYNVQPFMLVGLAALFLNEKITLQKLFWLGISFLGMLAIVSAHGGQGESGNDYLMGIALALGAAFLYAIAALIIKRLTGTPPHLIALVQVTTGVLLLAPFAHFSALPQAPSAWASLVTLGIVHTGVMYVLLYGAIQKLPTALTGALSFIYPIAAIFVDWFAFGHRLEPLQWIGVAAILLAAAGMQQGWNLKFRRTVTTQ
jgi:drug/metabolite transporter (DMT)-like permease